MGTLAAREARRVAEISETVGAIVLLASCQAIPPAPRARRTRCACAREAAPGGSPSRPEARRRPQAGRRHRGRARAAAREYAPARRRTGSSGAARQACMTTRLREIGVELEVPFHDIDGLGIVWHGNYFKYFELARTELCPRSPRPGGSTPSWPARTWGATDHARDHVLERGNLCRIGGFSRPPPAKIDPGTPGCCAGTCSAAWATSRDSAHPDCSPRGARPASRRLRRALAAVEQGTLRIGAAHEDVHTAVEDWLTRRLPGRASGCTPAAPATIRSPATSGSLLKDRCSRCTTRRSRWWRRLLAFASEHRTVLLAGIHPPAARDAVARWDCGPGPTPRACSTPSRRSTSLWRRVDRSPLGSAAGYGVPLPLRREAAARALGFAGLDRNVATVQGGGASSRPRCSSGAPSWATRLGRLAQDVILCSAEEFGYLVLPAELATGSSIMPHKRNPDLFELTRGPGGRDRGGPGGGARRSRGACPRAIIATSRC